MFKKKDFFNHRLFFESILCKQNNLTLLIILLTKFSRINLVSDTKMLYLCTTRFLGGD